MKPHVLAVVFVLVSCVKLAHTAEEEEEAGPVFVPPGDEGDPLPIEAVYYAPSVMGSSSFTDVYGAYFKEVQLSDMSHVKLVTDTIVTRNLGTDAQNDFFKIINQAGLNVIASFGLERYFLTAENIMQARTRIEDDFETFILHHGNRTSVTHVCIGSVNDPYLATDVNPGIQDSTSFHSQFRNLMKQLIKIAKGHLPDDVPVLIFIWTVSFHEQLFDAASDGDFTYGGLDHDGWIAYVGPGSREVVQPGLASYLDRGGKDTLLQFSRSAFDGNARTPQEDATKQMSDIIEMRSALRSPAVANSKGALGIVYMEWGDQLWRSSPGSFCDSQDEQLYQHSKCAANDNQINDAVQYYGMTAQFDKFGMHCTRFRKIFQKLKADFTGDDTFVDEQCTFIPKVAKYDVRNLTISGGFALTAFALLICVMIWSQVSRKEDSLIGFCFPCLNRTQPPTRSRAESEMAPRVANGGKKPSVDMDREPFELKIPFADDAYVQFYYEDEFNLEDHFIQQQENIDSMIYAQEPDLRENEDMDMAVEVVFNRMMEGYFVWATTMKHKGFHLSKLEFEDQYKKQLLGDHDSSSLVKHIHPNFNMDLDRVSRMYALTFMFRVMTCLAEHIIHCPERIAQVYDDILHNMKEPNSFNINISELQRGLDAINNNELNFDDINDYARDEKRPKEMRKYYKESTGVAVVLDLIRDYFAIFVAKAWLFGMAVYFYWLKEGFQLGLDFLADFVQFEAATFGALGIILTVYFFNRERHLDMRQIMYFIFGVVGVLAAGVIQLLPSPLPVLVAALYTVVRLISFVGFLLGFKDTVAFPGRVGNENSKITVQKGEVAFWLMTAALTLITEIFLIAPVGVVFTISQQCAIDSDAVNMFDSNGYIAQDQIACFLAVVVVYLLLAFTVLVDTYLIFNFMIAVAGYLVGQRRLIADVFTTQSFNIVSKDLNDTLSQLFPGRATIVWESIVHDFVDRYQCSKEHAEKLKGALKRNLDFSRMAIEPRDRIAFFLKTAYALKESSEVDSSRIQMRAVEDWIPKISQVITSFQENIFLSIPFLLQENGTKTNLDHLIDRHRYEWKFLEDYLIREHGVVRQFVNARERLRDFFLKINSDDYYKENIPEHIQQLISRYIREWSSNRAQTVSRTLRGAMSHHRAVDVSFDLRNDREMHHFDISGEPVPSRSRTSADGGSISRASSIDIKDADEDPEPLKEFVETIWAHQLYGQPNSWDPNWKQRRGETDELLYRYRDYPISVVFFWTPPKDLDTRGPCDCYGEVIDYWERSFDDDPIPRFASVVKKWIWKSKEDNDGGLEIVRVMPLRRPPRLGPRGFTTQGKAANQINAVRLISGNVIQVMDANMDSYIGEGFKVPFVTSMFTKMDNSNPKKEEKKLNGTVQFDGSEESDHLVNIDSSHFEDTPARIERASRALYRVIGFREYIFTRVTGTVGEQMANAESAFGTIFQRTLASPLNVRMHYGHPDFFDAYWVINRGMLSKGSPHINLSEDVFAGYNIFQRNEQNYHTDILEWQKGREETFYSSSGFMAKTSAGAVGCLRSRDLHISHRKLMFLRQLSSYYGGISYYVSQLLVDYTIFIYVLSFLLLSLAGITLNEVGSLHSALGSEWIISIGFVSMVPLVAEDALERGFLTAMQKLIKNLIPSTLFYLFQNKTTAKNFEKSILTGKAEYINTGRPTADTHYSLVDAYKFYCATHYYPALIILVMYIIYNKLTGSEGGTTPMIMIILTTVIWIASPVIFCPQIEANLRYDSQNAISFISRVEEKPESLYGFWIMEHRKFVDRSLSTRSFSLIAAVLKVLFFFVISYANAVDFAVYLTYGMTVQVPISIMYYYAQQNNFYNGGFYLLWLLYPALAVILISAFESPFGIFAIDKILGTWLFLLFTELIRQFILMFNVLYTCGKSKEERQKRQRHVSDTLFIASFTYHIHFYSACIIFLSQSILQVGVFFLKRILRFLFIGFFGQPLQHRDWVR